MTDSHNQNRNIAEFTILFNIINRQVIQFRLEDYQIFMNKFLLSLSNRVITRGSIDTISWVKDLRVAIYAYLGGEKVGLKHLGTRADGFPKIFGELHPFVKARNPKSIRFLLTLLQVSRFLEGQKAPDFTPITDKTRYTESIFLHFQQAAKSVLDEVQACEMEIPLWEGPHFTSKGSPVGPAMLSLKQDLVNLTPELISDIGVIGGPLLEKYIGILKETPEIITKYKEPKPHRKERLRALGLVNDTEAKTRVIAMADYWSQTSLLPLHEKLLNSLRAFGETDLTFGQDIQPFGKPSQPYYSYDLTSATDRIPRFLYVLCLEQMFGYKYSRSWERIMVGEGYHGPDGLVRKYETGQPMGLYSSWPLLAWVHHVIVRVAARDCGLRRFRDYRLLGDDIVIRHKDVAERYAQILKDLGVGISPTKTLVSKDTFEFAKRIFHQGQEVTGFPIHGIAMATRSGWQDVYNVMETASKRNFGELASLFTPRIIESFYKALGKDSQFARTAQRYCRAFYTLTSANTCTPFFRTVIRYWFPLLGCATDTETLFLGIRRRYLKELRGEIDKQLQDTINLLLNTFKGEPDDDMPLLKHIEDRDEARSEPLAWCMLDQSQNLDTNDLSLEEESDDYSADVLIEALRKIDYRIMNPNIFDRTRKAERVFRLRANLSIKAFAKEAKESQQSPILTDREAS